MDKSLTPAKNDPQGQGSAITYMRRYALSAILGIATEEDDDGNAASRTDRSAHGAVVEAHKAGHPSKAMVSAPPSIRQQKARIMELLGKLGKQTATKKQCEDAVFELTDLILKEDNYQQIIDRLVAAKEEREEVQKDIN
jgi:excinuclease UvrABC ATPase subunit